MVNRITLSSRLDKVVRVVTSSILIQATVAFLFLFPLLPPAHVLLPAITHSYGLLFLHFTHIHTPYVTSLEFLLEKLIFKLLLLLLGGT